VHSSATEIEGLDGGVKRSRARRVLRKVGRGLLLLIAAYLVVRAIVEPFIVNPFRPESYRQDWGGPHFLGVLLVHCGPGLIIAILAFRQYRRARRGQASSE
jgi:hypothetical protein